MLGIAMRFTKVFLGADHWTFEWGGGMGDFGIKMISCKLISTKEIPALKKKKRIMLKKKKSKQTNKTKTEKSYKKFYLQRFGEKKSYPNQITHIPPPPPPPLPPSTSQKSNGWPLFSQNSESCASFQTRRTRRLVEKKTTTTTTRPS